MYHKTIKCIVTCAAALLTTIFTPASAQCNCQTFTKEGNVVQQCTVLPVGGDKSLQIAIGIGKVAETEYISLSIRFRYHAQKVRGSITLTLTNGEIIELALLNSGLAYIGNSEICQSTFLLDSADERMLKKSQIATVAFYLEDNLRLLLLVTKNKNVVQSQLNSL